MFSVLSEKKKKIVFPKLFYFLSAKAPNSICHFLLSQPIFQAIFLLKEKLLPVQFLMLAFISGIIRMSRVLRTQFTLH